MVESSGINREELLRQENIRLVQQITDLFFTPGVHVGVDELSDPSLIELTCFTKSRNTNQQLEVHYLKTRDARVVIARIPQDLTMPAYFIRISEGYKESYADATAATKFGLLPAEFMDQNAQNIYVETTYFLNNQGQGLRHIDFLDLSDNDEALGIDEEELQRRAALPVLDLEITKSSSHTLPLEKEDQEVIGGVLHLVREGNFEPVDYWPVTRS